jgi:flavin reductase (DIM6/NTAB) family NADH-FMN oxidoreductase RutF
LVSVENMEPGNSLTRLTDVIEGLRLGYTLAMDTDPADLSLRDRYRLMISCIVPRPIAFVSTVSPDGRNNLAPYSYFTAVGAEPMTLLFCPGNLGDGREKDTLRNSKPVDEGGTGEFVVNVARQDYRRQVAAAAESLSYGESEFDLIDLEPLPSTVVRPPRLGVSPVAFECRTRQVLRLGEGKPGAANIVLGDIVYIHVEEAVLDERNAVDPAKLRAIGRLGGISYCTTEDRFELPRGRAALQSDED